MITCREDGSYALDDAQEQPISFALPLLAHYRSGT